MAKYQATVSWSSDGEFTSGRYSRGHELRFDGGAVVRAPPRRTSSRQFSDPAGVDPEEALVASASACHMLWFLSLAQAAGLDVASYRDEAAGTSRQGRSRPDRDHPDHCSARRSHSPAASRTPSELDRLHHEAHEKCFIANSLLTPIRIAPRG